MYEFLYRVCQMDRDTTKLLLVLQMLTFVHMSVTTQFWLMRGFLSILCFNTKQGGRLYQI